MVNCGKIKALILAGGKGTRLEPLTIDTPKPVIPLGNKPFLENQIQLIKKAGISDIILSLNHQSSVVKKILGDGSAFGVRLSYSIEPVPLGTAGGYKYAEKLLSSTTIVLNGDILTDIDLREVTEQHKKQNSTATIVLTKVENPKTYGLVEVGEEGKVLNFLEKPNVERSNHLKINTINAGIYVLESKALNYIPERENFSFEYQLFPDLLRRKEKFNAFVAEDNYWIDIGTPQRYLKAHSDFLNEKIKIFEINRNNKFEFSGKIEIDALSLVDEGCVIKTGAKIIKSVLGKNVLIGENTIVQNSVIWSGTVINCHSKISNSIVGNDCRIGSRVSLSAGAVLGGKTILDDFTNY